MLVGGRYVPLSRGVRQPRSRQEGNSANLYGIARYVVVIFHGPGDHERLKEVRDESSTLEDCMAIRWGYLVFRGIVFVGHDFEDDARRIEEYVRDIHE